MAGSPIKRAFKQLVKDRGGWQVILDREAAGETMSSIARDYGVSRPFLSGMLNRDPELQKLHQAALRESASAHAEKAMEIVDNAKPERDAIQLARVQAEHRRWLAQTYDRAQFGEVKQEGVTINLGQLHIEALRALNRPKPKELPEVTVEPQE